MRVSATIIVTDKLLLSMQAWRILFVEAPSGKAVSEDKSTNQQAAPPDNADEAEAPRAAGLFTRLNASLTG